MALRRALEVEPMTDVAVFDAKPYDRTALSAAGTGLGWKFLEHRLSADTASSARGSSVACVFVNDRLDRPALKALVDVGVKMVAFRCAGFNNLDAAAAKELGVAVTRVPAYSPYAVAEHAVALLLALNRKIHRAFNRVREMNFSLAGLEGFDLHGKTAGILGTGKIGRIARCRAGRLRCESSARRNGYGDAWKGFYLRRGPETDTRRPNVRIPHPWRVLR